MGSLESKKKYYRKLKLDAFKAYGGAECACCEEHEIVFLTLDHINGDGAAERKRLGIHTGEETYRWLRHHNYPPGFQVLCMNCNWAKHILGICPHELEGEANG